MENFSYLKLKKYLTESIQITNAYLQIILLF